MRKAAEIDFKGKRYKVYWWTGEWEAVPENGSAPIAGLDTETEPIVKGKDPDPVLMQVGYPGTQEVHLVSYEYMDDYIEALSERNPEVIIGMHNVGFDMDVLRWRNSSFLYQKFMSEEIMDTGIRFYLKRASEGYPPERYMKLSDITKFFFNITMDKDEETRLGFRKNMKFTAKDINYAALDAVVTAEAMLLMPDRYPTEFVNTKGYVAAYYMQKLGIGIDYEYLKELNKKYNNEKEDLERRLEVFGYLPGVSGTDTVLQQTLKDIEEQKGIKLPKTPSGKVSTDKDVIQEWEIDHPFIEAFKRHSYVSKVIKTHLDLNFVKEDGRAHPYFNPMLPTERYSCSNPNAQNPPKEGGIRQQYVPAPGYVYYNPDFNQIELGALAESNYQRFGFSRQGEKINMNMDIYVDTASGTYGIPYEELLKRREEGDKEADNLREASKEPVLGYPGGMGSSKMAQRVRAQGFKDFTTEDADKIKETWLEQYPEMKQHLNPEVDTYFTVRSVKEYCKTNKINLKDYTIEALSEYLKEEKEYSDSKIFGEIKHLKKYMVTLFTGYTVRNRTFCQACNLQFQPIAAEGLKEGAFNLIMENFRLCNAVHDEVLVELPLDDKLQDNVKRVNRILIDSMKTKIRNFEVRVEGGLMERWDKNAEEIYDDEGNLCIWRPEEGQDEKKESTAENAVKVKSNIPKLETAIDF